MYSTCLYCHHSLGANEVVEQFPVGRRLAFDLAKGRLWVICAVCERWNLTPLEERWEAAEECERLFRGATLRASTGQIGLARVGDGVHLVRIGEPLRPEMAAWRYGSRFGDRRRRTIVRNVARGAARTGVFGVVAVVALVAPVVAVPVLVLGGGLVGRSVKREIEGIVAVAHDGDDDVALPRWGLAGVRLAWESDRSDWALELPSFSGRIALRGASAIQTAGTLLPLINSSGGTGSNVEQAVQLLEHHGSPEALFRWIASEWDGTATGYRDRRDGHVEFVAEGAHGFLHRLEPAQRLALEMAAHEETERQAMQGELAALERAWRDAEEVAAIADDLLIPAGVRDWIARHRTV